MPAGDVLVHAGDFTEKGPLGDPKTTADALDFLDWFCSLPHKHKVLVAGNHDTFATTEEGRNELRSRDIHYLEDDLELIEGLIFYGTPWVHAPTWASPGPPWWNFAKQLGSVELAAKRASIPGGVDVLVTHSPPWALLDEGGTRTIEHCGCARLLDRVLEIQPEIHVFGHIHEAYGITTFGRTTFVNAAVRNHNSGTLNPAQVLDI